MLGAPAIMLDAPGNSGNAVGSAGNFSLQSLDQTETMSIWNE